MKSEDEKDNEKSLWLRTKFICNIYLKMMNPIYHTSMLPRNKFYSVDTGWRGYLNDKRRIYVSTTYMPSKICIEVAPYEWWSELSQIMCIQIMYHQCSRIPKHYGERNKVWWNIYLNSKLAWRVLYISFLCTKFLGKQSVYKGKDKRKMYSNNK